MQNGVILTDAVSGLKLLVIEQADTAFRAVASEITYQGRPLSEEVSIPAGKDIVGAVLTCDPGDRG